MALGAVARESARSVPPAIELPTRMPQAFRSLLGLYLAQQFGELVRVEWRDGALTVVDYSNDEWRPVLAPTGDPDVFVVEPGVRESGGTPRFGVCPTAASSPSI